MHLGKHQSHHLNFGIVTLIPPLPLSLFCATSLVIANNLERYKQIVYLPRLNSHLGMSHQHVASTLLTMQSSLCQSHPVHQINSIFVPPIMCRACENLNRCCHQTHHPHYDMTKQSQQLFVDHNLINLVKLKH